MYIPVAPYCDLKLLERKFDNKSYRENTRRRVGAFKPVKPFEILYVPVLSKDRVC